MCIYWMGYLASIVMFIILLFIVGDDGGDFTVSDLFTVLAFSLLSWVSFAIMVIGLIMEHAENMGSIVLVKGRKKEEKDV